MSRAIRIDAEVKRVLDAERLPDERNYNAAILRLLKRRKIRKMLEHPSPYDMLLTLKADE